MSDFSEATMRGATSTPWTRVAGIIDRVRLLGKGKFGGGFFGQGFSPVVDFSETSVVATDFAEL